MSKVTVVRIENDDLILEVANYGAAIVRFESKKDGINMVTSYLDVDLYSDNAGPYLGATIGPTAGRLQDAQVGSLKVKPNDGKLQLHGGVKGAHHGVFNLDVKGTSITCTAVLDHSEDGYPGLVDYTVRYTLEGADLIIEYEVIPEYPQYLNVTNHSYFNLLGSDSIGTHMIHSNAKQMTLVNADLTNTGALLDVEGTCFDWSQKTLLQDVLNCNHAQYEYTRNLDHFMHGNKLVLETEHKSMTVETQAPGFQVYASNYFDESFIDDTGRIALNHMSLAIEPQEQPNLPNLVDATMYDKAHPFKRSTKYSIVIK